MASPSPLPVPGSVPYADALAWLYARRRGGAPRDPRRMVELMRALGLRSPPSVAHVVGTNGKGTVTAMLDAGLRAWGMHTGRFVSPHVEDFRERVWVAGRPISRETVRRFVARVALLSLPAPPAFFEWTLALALDAFARAGVDWAAVEAGVGGASDATRALGSVRLVVVTNVTKDHLEVLGPELTDVARDKAGALRPGIPAVTGAEGVALEVLRAEAARLGAPLYVDDGRLPLFEAPRPGTPLATARWRNARLAAGALRLLGAPESAVRSAVEAPPLPARAERFQLGRHQIVLDGAHDPAAAALLADSLPAGYVLLFGALPRKQVAGTLAPLEAKASSVVLTEAAPGEPPTAVMAGRVFEPDPRRALDLALRAGAAPGLIVVAGSLHLAGRLRPVLRRRSAARARPEGSGSGAGRSARP